MIALLRIILFFCFAGTLSAHAQESYMLNYDNVEVRAVTQDIARFAKKTIILDPRVKGKVTIFSDSLLDQDQVWQVYLRTIQVNGFSAINEGNIVRIIPENEATRDSNDQAQNADYVTKIFLLENRTAGELLPMLKPITGRQAHLSSITSINSIILVDRKSNVDRVQILLQELDRDDTAKISIIKLNNLSSVEAVRILDKLKLQSNPTINNFIAIPFTQSNSVILSANKIVSRNVESTLRILDEDVQNDGTVAVIYLKYAKAEEVASIINTVSSSFVAESDTQKPVVTYHGKTNSLIVSSEDSNLDLIRNLVAKIDIRRAQVLVEAIIVELSENAAKSLGIETIFSGSDDGTKIPIGITRFPDGNSPDLLAITGNSLEGGDDATLGAIATNSLLNTQGLVAGFGSLDSDGDSFVGIINAIAEDQNSNILSTPSIIAMDNEPASLVIGQEIPITTGESLGANNANPFRTTARQEVGVKLSITPQINEGNSVILEIKQEVSGVAGALTGGSDVITNKRTIETTVLVDNNQIIVLGGLIDDDIQETISRVPVLGDIPILGRLFRSSSKSVIRRNLTVFLRPKILADSKSVNQISLEKYNFIKAEGLLNESREEIIDLSSDQD
ncbi:MAG: type II secretion system secretin GspD [Gammaproteobacteria bacterium]|nr:type II secretion system protein GspD [Gammaproteobacteria bacterium]|tara:strand:+ start:7258 stop:9114 length:1857 start_codon:yes stop_codon:yes gene_type:complete